MSIRQNYFVTKQWLYNTISLRCMRMKIYKKKKKHAGTHASLHASIIAMLRALC